MEAFGARLTSLEVTVAPFLSENEQRPQTEVRQHRQRTRPPNHRVPDQVDLLFVLDPKVLPWRRKTSAHVTGNNTGTHNSTSEDWPCGWPRIVRMPIGKTLVRLPHDALQFEEFRQEAGFVVVYRLTTRPDCSAVVSVRS